MLIDYLNGIDFKSYNLIQLLELLAANNYYQLGKDKEILTLIENT